MTTIEVLRMIEMNEEKEDSDEYQKERFGELDLMLL